MQDPSDFAPINARIIKALLIFGGIWNILDADRIENDDTFLQTCAKIFPTEIKPHLLSANISATSKKNLLSLDGGGIRGIFLIQVSTMAKPNTAIP